MVNTCIWRKRRCRLLHKFPALCLLLDQGAVGVEFHFHFDLLETPVISDQSLADDIEGAITFILQAEIIFQIYAAFDDLTTAIAFELESVVSFFASGSCAAKEIFEEAHMIPFKKVSVVSIQVRRTLTLLDQRDHLRISSIFSNSSSLNFKLFNAARLSSSCLTLLAPINAEVIAGLRKTQAIAIWARDCPRCCASSLSF